MSLEDVTVDNPHPKNPVIVEKGYETPQEYLQEKTVDTQEEESEKSLNEVSQNDEESSNQVEGSKQGKLELGNNSSEKQGEKEEEGLLWKGANA